MWRAQRHADTRTLRTLMLSELTIDGLGESVAVMLFVAPLVKVSYGGVMRGPSVSR